jgi:DNA-binding XRE family transcriptional regulator
VQRAPHRHWTPAAVVAAIQARRAAGQPCHYQAVVRDDEALTGAARRHFGSWNEALRAAGYDPATIRYPPVEKRPPGYWSTERVIDQLRTHVAAGHGLAAHIMDKLEPGLVPTAQRLFGSWAAAVEAAGYDYAAVRLTRAWSPDTVIQRLRDAAARGADLSDHTAQALAPDLYGAARQHFGGWPPALTAAGLDPDAIRRTTRWDAERLRTLAQRLAAAGVPPAPVFAVLGLESTVLDHYPSMAALWAAAELTSPPPPPLRPRIRAHRQARHWSLDAVARRLGVSYRLVSMWELGQAVPRLGHALALAQVLGVPVESLWESPSAPTSTDTNKPPRLRT